MKKMLLVEFEENEEDWVDFKDDELELKLEISNLLFDDMIEEAVLDFSKFRVFNRNI